MYQRKNPVALVIALCMLLWCYSQAGALFYAGQPQLWPSLWLGLSALVVLELLQLLFTSIASLFDWLSSYQPTGKSGTSRWAIYRDIKKDLIKNRSGPFWGRLVKGHKAVFCDYDSNAVTVAPAGSGKGTCSVVPNALAIRHSKLMPDFKGELACILKAPLEARGEKVVILNPAGLWQDQMGETASYNPLDILVDDLYRAGGLRDVPDDLREFTAQIYPEPEGKSSENHYFREGSRRLIGDVMLLLVMVEEYEATLSSVALLIEDRERLAHHFRWLAGVDLEGKPLPEGPMPIEQTRWAGEHDAADLTEFAALIRAKAKNWLKLMDTLDSRTFDSFISGAQMGLAPFAFGRLSSAMGRSTFSMDDLKSEDQVTTLFIVADASRMESFKHYIAMMQFCAFTAIKRHANKKVPCYAIMDEATNYKINGLADLLTWGRGYGLRIHLIFQDFSAFERVYGKTALETLQSETEIKQFLPGQRSPKTLEMIEKLLGDQSVMAASFSQKGANDAGGLSESTSESARALMKTNEIRQTPYGILMIRRHFPILFEPLTYAEVHPWRNIVGINPFHGKPFKKKVKLRL